MGYSGGAAETNSQTWDVGDTKARNTADHSGTSRALVPNLNETETDREREKKRRGRERKRGRERVIPLVTNLEVLC